MFKRTATLGTVNFKGQRALVIAAIARIPDSFTRDQVVAAIDKDAYERSFRHGKQVVTIPESVQYHLTALTKLGQLEVYGSIPIGKPGGGIDLGIGGRMGSENRGRIRSTAADSDLRDMAREWYGYGRWDAPYWFIGPEPGMDSTGDNLQQRCEAWMRLGAGELVDCKEHHYEFGEYEWHREIPPAKLQSTWKKLIRLLLACRNGNDPSNDDVLTYQKRLWGMRNGESCVIELCSLAAKNAKAKKNVAFDPDRFRQQRIDEIRRKIEAYKPAYVVMYRLRDKPSWDEIAGGSFSAAPDIRPLGKGPTLAVFANHPVDNVGVKNQYWIDLAKRLRRSMGLPPCRETGDN